MGRKHMATPQTQPKPSASSSSASSSASGVAGDLRAKAGDAVARIGDVASGAVDEAKRSANTLAAEAGEKVKSMLNQQLGVGADLAGHVATSARAAADSLDSDLPQLAELVRVAGDRVERLAQDIRRQPIDEL